VPRAVPFDEARRKPGFAVSGAWNDEAGGSGIIRATGA
jgi:hypothetical protein